MKNDNKYSHARKLPRLGPIICSSGESGTEPGPPARPSEANFALPEPARSPNFKKNI